MDVQFIIVDEVSMLSNKVFEWVESRLREMRGKSEPFGGYHILLVGDLFQLPPVCSRFVFQGMSTAGGLQVPNPLWPMFEFFELTEVMRQKEDFRFAECLNRVREGLHTKDDIALLMTQDCPHSPSLNLRTIYFTNAEVNSHNMLLYKSSTQSKCAMTAYDTHTWQKKPEVYRPSELATRLRTTDTAGLEETLCLYIGCDIQISINLDVRDGLVNGANAKVTHFTMDQDEVKVVWLLFPYNTVGHRYRRDYYNLYKIHGVSNTEWTPFERAERHFTFDRTGRQICRRQFPFRLSTAMTAHRAQGQTLESGVIHFVGMKNAHLAYVALSRFQKLLNVRLVGFDASWIKTHPLVKKEMDRLRSMPLEPIPLRPRGTHCRLLYQNVRTLHKYMQDVKRVVNVIRPCHAVFVETHLTPRDMDEFVTIQGYGSQRYDTGGNGMVVYSTKIIPTTTYKHVKGQYEYVSWDMIIGCKSIRFVAVYVWQACPVRNLLKGLHEVLAGQDNNVVFGDFNICATRLPEDLQLFLANLRLRQIILQSTTPQDSTIDHVWTTLTNVYVFLFPSYYSDHFPIVLDFQD